mmetsp:Transcript_27760/g.68277  ORF Transcript_27760/g.68277 Transcript_27760/m.68277 type:complete len:163 (-) Transcript_27760:671-1159(-)
MSQNAKLKANAEEQVTRLLTQLADLEELRGELDDDEYAETLGSTLQQLGEFRASLKRMAAGDITLLNELESIRMATQAAVSKAFKTPDILKMFALKQPTQLRERLEVIRRNHKLGKVTAAAYKIEAVEILTSLKKLVGELSAVGDGRGTTQRGSGCRRVVYY